jgi:hypothetical protein
MRDLTPILKKILDSLLFKGKVNFNIETSFDSITNDYFYTIIVELDVDKMSLISPIYDNTYDEIVDEYDFHDRLDDVLRYLGSDINFNIIFNHFNYEKTNEKLREIETKIQKLFPRITMNMSFDKDRIRPVLNVITGFIEEKMKEKLYYVLTDDFPDGFKIIDMIINLKN